MLSQSKIKHLRALQQKKYRNSANLFFIEGEKMLEEAFLQTKFAIREIFVTEDYFKSNKKRVEKCAYTIISDKELARISAFKSPNSGLATLEIPAPQIPTMSNGLYLYLDTIQDPGNLGTILRTADWFGVDAVFCSNDTADVYNTKVLQSTMGAIFRVPFFYASMEEVIPQLPLNIEIAGAFLGGDNLYHNEFSKNLLLVLGNESKGISTHTAKHIAIRLTIPNYGKSDTKTESLNVAQAGSIFLAEYRRRFE